MAEFGTNSLHHFTMSLNMATEIRRPTTIVMSSFSCTQGQWQCSMIHACIPHTFLLHLPSVSWIWLDLASGHSGTLLCIVANFSATISRNEEHIQECIYALYKI